MYCTYLYLWYIYIYTYIYTYKYNSMHRADLLRGVLFCDKMLECSRCLVSHIDWICLEIVESFYSIWLRVRSTARDHVEWCNRTIGLSICMFWVLTVLLSFMYLRASPNSSQDSTCLLCPHVRQSQPHSQGYSSGHCHPRSRRWVTSWRAISTCCWVSRNRTVECCELAISTMIRETRQNRRCKYDELISW